MKQQTIFIADDGTSFYHEKECAIYEALCKKVELCMAKLPSRTKEVESGTDRLLHDISLLRDVFNEFLDICKEEVKSCSEWVVQIQNGGRHYSHIERVISECGVKCLKVAYWRFNCINFDSGFEYSQPYYANNEEEFLRWINK